jgi:hypothetical protein
VIGTVDGVEGDRIAVRGAGDTGEHHHVPEKWVERVDDHVHLDRTAALARETWMSHGEDLAHGEMRREIGGDSASGARKVKWLPWAILALLVLMSLYYLVRGFSYSAEEPDYEKNSNGLVESVDT